MMGYTQPGAETPRAPALVQDQAFAHTHDIVHLITELLIETDGGRVGGSNLKIQLGTATFNQKSFRFMHHRLSM